MSEVSQYALSRGGASQKAKAFEEQHFKSVRSPTHLSDLLIQLFVWGQVPAVLVQQIAAAAIEDVEEAKGPTIRSWAILAGLGSKGLHTNNVNRDLLRKLDKPSFMLSWHGIPQRAAATKGSVGRTAILRLPLLLPRDVWCSIWKSGTFKQFICHTVSDLEIFWQSTDTHPAVQHHPMKQIENWRRRAVPLSLHGDAAAITLGLGSSSKSCLFLSFKSMVARKTFQHFLLAAIWSHCTVKTETGAFNTSKSLFRIISDDFLQMLSDEGKYSDGYFPVVLFTTGDLEYFADWHGLPRWNSKRPCAFCAISNREIGNWKFVTALEPDPWQTPRTSKCPLFRSLVSPQGVCPDYMHTKHLGTDLRFLGSVCWLLLMTLMPDVLLLEDRLQTLLAELKEYWSMNQMPMGINALTTGMVMAVNDKQCWKTYPKLKVKANEAALSLPAFKAIWEKRMNGSEQSHIWVKLALEATCNMDRILRDSNEQWKLSIPESNKLWQAAIQFTVCNSALEKHFAKENRCLFKHNTFKHHWLLHCCKMAAFVSPRHVWCYSGEDFMRKMKKLMQSCLAGRAALSSQRRFMERYVLALTFELKHATSTWKLK